MSVSAVTTGPWIGMVTWTWSLDMACLKDADVFLTYSDFPIPDRVEDTTRTQELRGRFILAIKFLRHLLFRIHRRGPSVWCGCDLTIKFHVHFVHKVCLEIIPTIIYHKRGDNWSSVIVQSWDNVRFIRFLIATYHNQMIICSKEDNRK